MANRAHLLEQVQFTKPLKVDRVQGIIYGAKLLGWQSKNGYNYDPQWAKKAVEKGLYESVKGYTDHPPKENVRAERPVKDAFCRYFDVHWTPDGVYGNIKYNTAHPLADTIANDAEQGLGNVGCSHNADGDKRMMPNGRIKILEIFEIRSVDIVTRPATTYSLSESVQEKPMATPRKFTAILESLSCDRRVPKNTRKKLLEFMDSKACASPEMEAELEPPESMDDPDAAMDHNDILHGGFSAALHSLIDEGLDDGELMKRVKELLKAKSSLLGGDKGSGEPIEEEDDEEGMQESVRVLKRENKAYKLLLESDVRQPPDWLLKGVSLLESEQEQRKMIHDYRMDNQPRGGIPRTPRPAEPTPKGGKVKNHDDFLSRVTSKN